MEDFPQFMRGSANRIAQTSQSTPGAEGYVFDGLDGSQLAFWTCHQAAVSEPHSHEYDEYMIVAKGCYTLIINDKRITLKTGDEYFIPLGTWHWGEVIAGTRTIHAFGGKRVIRYSSKMATVHQ